MSEIASHTALEWREMLKSYLPRGRAWQAAPGSVLEGLLFGLAEEFARAEARLVKLIDEADALTSAEMIGDWERVLNLPDSCAPATGDLAARQMAANQRLVAVGGQSALYFRQLAAEIGYTVEIQEFRAARIGDRIGRRLFSGVWQFAWGVRVLIPGPAELDLECLIRRHAPAHTTVFFIYDEED